MRIGLFGFTLGHENMGCQALTCAFIEIIKRNINTSNLEIVFFTNEKTMGKIPELFPDISFSKCGVSLKKIPPIFIKETQKCDYIFDVTYGDGFSDIYFVKSVYRDSLIKYWLGKKKTLFILAPQTYGPFKRKSLEWLAGKAIHAADYAFARDQISADYATRLSKREVTTVTDVAFSLSYVAGLKETEKIKIGLNVSGLLWNGGFSDKNQFGLRVDYKEYCKKLIMSLSSRGYEVHLIPHVTKTFDPNREIPDGDYPACELLHSMFNGTKLAPCFDTPYDAKNYISSMDAFVGARMHATIGAFSSGVATIPFAYSRKFQGLYENLGYNYFIDAKKCDTEEAVLQTLRLIENRSELNAVQQKAMNIVKKNLDKFEQQIKRIIDNEN